MSWLVVVLAVVVGSSIQTTMLRADVLVTRDGERIETRGPWTVKGKQVVFTAANGTLQALRLDDVDLEASEEATHPPETPPPPPPPPVVREPVLTITDDDIPRHTDDAPQGSSVDRLISRLRGFHETQDVAGAMDLVHREGMTPSVTQAVRTILDKIMASTIRDVSFQPFADGPRTTTPGDLLAIGQLLIDIETTDGATGTTVERASFAVAEHLGGHVLIAPTTALSAPAPPAGGDASGRERGSDDGSEGP